jgi:hypothetical protein
MVPSHAHTCGLRCLVSKHIEYLLIKQRACNTPAGGHTIAVLIGTCQWPQALL